MTQDERRRFLIQYLLREEPQYAHIAIPKTELERRQLLRGLMNIRLPKKIGEDFLSVQDEYLQTELKNKGITDAETLPVLPGDLVLWQGDITTLHCDGIVNAANSRLLGCFHPCHGCIDNAIHTYAGVQLRLVCAEIMQKQGQAEAVGGAKITPAFNLPSRYVLHTVGPIVAGALTETHERQLAACYRSCLQLAEEYGLRSLAFCCISTGEFHFPPKRAAEIALQTVRTWKEQTHSTMKVIFNVFTKSDEQIYKRQLGIH